MPTVNISPENLIVSAGSNPVLNTNAIGLPPLSFRGKQSGAIPGATNASYTIFDAQATNSDNYSVIVSDPYANH